MTSIRFLGLAGDRRMAIMMQRLHDLPRTLFWLAFGLFVMAAWPILPRRWIDMDAPWWRRYEGWGER